MTERLMTAISRCLDWANEADPPPLLQVDALVLLLRAHEDAGAHEPGDWTVDDVHEVAALLTERGEPPEHLRDTWLSWCDHLVSRGALMSTESPRRLRTAIEQVDLTPGAPTAPGPEPLADAAAPLLERLGYGESGEPALLLPFVPAPLSELDARAGAVDTLHRAARLAAWVDPDRLLRPGTDHDDLCPTDTAQAAEALGTTPRDVRFLFTVARSAGLLRTTYLHVLPGPAAHAWADERPGAAADAWADALTTMAAIPGPAPFLLLTELFLSGRAHTPAELVHACGPGAVPGPESAEQHVHRVLRTLARLEAVQEVANGRYRISALGDHCAARRLRASGIEVPEAPSVTALDAEAFLGVLEEVRPVDVEALLDRWITGQPSPETAARTLVNAGLPPVGADAGTFVRTVAERPWADVVLALTAECPLKGTAELAR
ncbi:hypothetical protein H4W79_002124 [Nocardiopsis terrae]|uniref:TIGR02678 family protein n=1 Tax=Nocardiopsis terrae TaxID=372655 RepID=A0ABR9HFV0_9ACTN|nr:hypothetical protein [Nocardiopsis terrae]MBE1457910.1 hypothetical protein [Nocardiopsis terrae]